MDANALCITVLDISSELPTIILHIKECPLSRAWLKDKALAIYLMTLVPIHILLLS
jgi:hypothetical protein